MCIVILCFNFIISVITLHDVCCKEWTQSSFFILILTKIDPQDYFQKRERRIFFLGLIWGDQMTCMYKRNI